MMQGTPYVYQGEELGMTNIYFDKLEDYRNELKEKVAESNAQLV